MDNQGLTVTFCDRGENHVRNQQIGQLAPSGFTYEELQTIQSKLVAQGFTAHLVNLGQYLPPEYGQYNAGVLVIKGGLQIFCDEATAWTELRNLTYDKKAVMYGRVCNKKARHNLCFANFDQAPDYENGKGTVVAFNHLPQLSLLRNNLPTLLNNKATNLLAEANHYYNVDKCGIGYHGDKERRIVVGVRYGKSFPLCFHWYYDSKRVSMRVDFMLDHGDIYVMDQKACGCDAALRKTPTLRHARDVMNILSNIISASTNINEVHGGKSVQYRLHLGLLLDIAVRARHQTFVSTKTSLLLQYLLSVGDTQN